MSAGRQERQGPIVVGYTADDRGREALGFAATLANSTGAELIICLVLPEPSPLSPLPSGDAILRSQVEAWQREALELVPGHLAASIETKHAAHEAEGLLAAVADHGADMIVVGARRGPLLRHFAIGRTANALLHSSPVPVALAPVGSAYRESVPRVTAAYGSRPGAAAVIATAVELADAAQAPLRLLALQAGRQATGISNRLAADIASIGGETLGPRADRVLGTETASIDIVAGADLDEAADRATWHAGEIVIVGSSRLARRGSVFIGRVAQRLLAATPATLIVIPRDYRGGDGTD